MKVLQVLRTYSTFHCEALSLFVEIRGILFMSHFLLVTQQRIKHIDLCVSSI